MKCEPGCTCKRHLAKGVKREPEVGRQISASKIGHEVTEETRKKLGDLSRGRKQSVEQVTARAELMTVHRHNVRGNRTGTYRSWDGMKQRCLNPKATGYKRYGGAGVTVAERWLKFSNFLADMGIRPAGTTLERIDGSKGYEPGNCRWATVSEQNRNRPNFQPDKRSHDEA